MNVDIPTMFLEGDVVDPLIPDLRDTFRPALWRHQAKHPITFRVLRWFLTGFCGIIAFLALAYLAMPELRELSLLSNALTLVACAFIVNAVVDLIYESKKTIARRNVIQSFSEQDRECLATNVLQMTHNLGAFDPDSIPENACVLPGGKYHNLLPARRHLKQVQARGDDIARGLCSESESDIKTAFQRLYGIGKLSLSYRVVCALKKIEETPQEKSRRDRETREKERFDRAVAAAKAQTE